MNAEEVKNLRTLLKLTQIELADKIGVSFRTIQNYEAGGVIPPAKQKLLLGMLNEVRENISPSHASALPEYKIVPLLPIAARGGTLNDFVVSVKPDDCEKVISPVRDADFAMTVTGDSMAPEYPSGSRILIKKIDERAFIEWGRVYVLDTCNGSVIKKIMPGPTKEQVRCESLNPEFPGFNVSFKDMYGMYRVLMLLTEK